MEITIVVIYTLAMIVLFLYSLAQLTILFSYLKSKRNPLTKEQKFDFSNENEIPLVTIQLPIFNELYMVESLLDNIAKLDYPKDKLEIQVLDDSTDESVEITKNKVAFLQEAGLNISYIHRTNREGFKAGALKEGLEFAKGEFIAIFDADFLPKPNWLLETIPYFKDSKIGVVQTRWGHTNRNYSLLTKIQAFALDFHFTIEQTGRNAKKDFINFNGTAGVWRKECIFDAGNWQGDTLTEDLDLSYRAQLKDWEFKYLEQVETPAELPVVISAARSQQFRWSKGPAENFKKTFKAVLANKTLPLSTKVQSLFHLLNSTMFVFVLLTGLLSVPLLYIKNNNPLFGWYFNLMAFFALSSLVFYISYWVSYKELHGGGVKNFTKYTGLFLTFFSIAMGFSMHNTIAVIEGHMGKRSEFVRTPKFNLKTIGKSWRENKYIAKNISTTTIMEALLMGYFAFGLYSAYLLDDYGLSFYHSMLFFGFSFVFIKSITSKM